VRGRGEFEGEFVLAESERETARIVPNFVSARTIQRHLHHQRVSAKQRVHELPAPCRLYTYLITFTQHELTHDPKENLQKWIIFSLGLFGSPILGAEPKRILLGFVTYILGEDTCGNFFSPFLPPSLRPSSLSSALFKQGSFELK
jgi:hypothetical protein